MLRYLIAGLFILTTVVVAYVGCGPRGRVAGKQVLDKIDGVLGKLNVELEKVETAYAQLSENVAGLRESRIKAQFEVDSIVEKEDDLKSKLDGYKEGLTRLKELINEADSDGKVMVNGKEKTTEELTSLAQQTLKKYKKVKTELDTNIKPLSETWSKNLTMMKNQESTSKQQLEELENRIEQIKAKKMALDAMKEASTFAGTESSISDKFDDLTKDVDDLLKEVEVGVAVEMEKIDERMSDAESDLSIDEILGADSNAEDTLSEIDEILGGN